jgi:hypothetical protein
MKFALFYLLPSLILTSCGAFQPVGTLGMALNGDAAAPPQPTKADYLDKPALRQNTEPIKWQMRF